MPQFTGEAAHILRKMAGYVIGIGRITFDMTHVFPYVITAESTAFQNIPRNYIP